MVELCLRNVAFLITMIDLKFYHSNAKIYYFLIKYMGASSRNGLPSARGAFFA